ncbi:MAG: SRPBCC family protein [Candidatus Eisenbacteria bacterium]|uniref:SRPBCC family protein n=1 Tax=Eiseniibacteriota bacterium TaxID=2212470 RepID=A0A7Y2E5H4_UNCEI|nr:SRPBCC family protein [Candidatus Eisenbacteria bacterium]
MPTFIKKSEIPASAEDVFRWHTRPQALNDLTPPWEPAELAHRTGGIEDIGSQVTLKVGHKPFRITWLAEHTACEPGRSFVDVQRKGPFAKWIHTHSMIPKDQNSCWLEDRIEYALPLAPLSEWLAGWYVRRKLERMFQYRHQVTREALQRKADL